MAQQLEEMLNLIGDKFDQSFHEGQDKKEVQDLTSSGKWNIVPQDNSVSQQILKDESLNKPTSQQLLKETYQIETQQNDQLQDCGLKHYESACQFVRLERSNIDFEEGSQNIEDSKRLKKYNSTEGETDEQELSREQESNYYKSLNEKFEMALNKVNSKKAEGLKKDLFIQKLENYGKNRQKELTKLRIQKQKEDSKYFKDRPLINCRSQQIISNYHQPIQDRYKNVIAQKMKKIEFMAEEKKQRQKQQQQRLIKQIQEHQQSIREKIGVIRTEQQYYEDSERWFERKQKKIEEMVKKKQDQIRATILEKPVIDPKSDNIMKKKSERVLIHYKQPEIKKLRLDKNYTFKPNLNKTTTKK